MLQLCVYILQYTVFPLNLEQSKFSKVRVHTRLHLYVASDSFLNLGSYVPNSVLCVYTRQKEEEIHGDRVTCYDSRDVPTSIATETGISRGDHVCLKCRGRLDRIITKVEQQVLAPLYV